ncbi:hypothetical protein [Synoicihabitans lomoniglobus]|uniref:Uncharacterized protein n=1 Tax=Synoicihabitans lomoniglobus TaxID=2909285 RepID=A0AAF0I3I2_9BACT|nr:hypothetical protein [Opitutaceae bacterium LMO-M01]WED66149.1 hypothetical protein PXH66_04730 [Opitutaceae bacterium LMO-M01]
MQKSTAHAFINKLLIYMLLTIGFNGSVGLGIVWMRHQISQSAAATKQSEGKLAAVERRLAETTARLAVEQAPDALEAKNVAMALGLVEPAEMNIVRIDESPAERLAAKRNLEIFSRELTDDVESVRFSFVSRGSR